jgi:phosphosulfolactate phosphohydrolase-like enzyme
VALHLAREANVDATFLASTAAGRSLVELGMEGDLETCAHVDRHVVAPVMRDGMVRLPSGSRR